MNREPLLTTAGIAAIVSAIVALLVAFGLDLSEGQTAAILGVVSVLAPLIVGLLARRKVTPTSDPKTDDGAPLVPGIEPPVGTETP